MSNVCVWQRQIWNLCTSCRSTDKQAHKSIHRLPDISHTHLHNYTLFTHTYTHTFQVFVRPCVFCHSLRAQLLSFISTAISKVELNITFNHTCMHMYICTYVHTHIYFVCDQTLSSVVICGHMWLKFQLMTFANFIFIIN